VSVCVRSFIENQIRVELVLTALSTISSYCTLYHFYPPTRLPVLFLTNRYRIREIQPHHVSWSPDKSKDAAADDPATDSDAADHTNSSNHEGAFFCSMLPTELLLITRVFFDTAHIYST